jgi:hypothetical protein
MHSHVQFDDEHWQFKNMKNENYETIQLDDTFVNGDIWS